MFNLILKFVNFNFLNYSPLNSISKVFLHHLNENLFLISLSIKCEVIRKFFTSLFLFNARLPLIKRVKPQPEGGGISSTGETFLSNYFFIVVTLSHLKIEENRKLSFKRK